MIFTIVIRNGPEDCSHNLFELLSLIITFGVLPTYFMQKIIKYKYIFTSEIWIPTESELLPVQTFVDIYITTIHRKFVDII